jgi:ribonucleoside-triphosphate reductase
VGIIGDVCPRCGRREGEEIPFERVEELRKKYPKMPAFQGIE